jgi:Putative zinc-finger
MTCHDAREQFSALVDDALAAGGRAAVEAHLATCADCRRELQRFRDTVSLVRAVAPVRAPSGFVDRLLEAARPVPWPRRLVRGLFLPWPVKLPMEAAALVLVGVGVALVYRGSPELQQSARMEPVAPVVARAPESTAPQATALARSRATDALREKYDAGDPNKTKDQAQASGKAREPREAASQTGPEPAQTTDKKTAATPPAAETQQSDALSRDAELRQVPDRRAKQEPEAVRKLVMPPVVAERAPTEQNVRPQPAPGARVDTSMAPVPRPPASAGAASSLAPPEVSGQLVVSDRDVALRQVGELITRLGAVENRRVDGSDGPILELTMPREAYAEFTRELARLGRWQPSKEPSTLPAQIRVVLRITG